MNIQVRRRNFSKGGRLFIWVYRRIKVMNIQVRRRDFSKGGEVIYMGV